MLSPPPAHVNNRAEGKERAVRQKERCTDFQLSVLSLLCV
jgi:hypothetical protein